MWLYGVGEARLSPIRPPISRIQQRKPAAEAKDKNATDCTDYTDSKSLADHAFELVRTGTEDAGQRKPESHGGQGIQGLRVVFCVENFFS